MLDQVAKTYYFRALIINNLLMQCISKYLVIVTSVMLHLILNSQEGNWECGHSAAEHELEKSSLRMKLLLERSTAKLDKDLAVYMDSKTSIGVREGPVYTIPVVFHILHNEGPEKISIDQCKSAIDRLNQDYSASNPEAPFVMKEFVDKQADCKIKFRLASIAPNGNCFPGVTYTRSNITNRTKKWFTRVNQADAVRNGNNVYQGNWQGDKYLNIIVCKSVKPNTNAYAFRPFNNIDMGYHIFIRAEFVGTIGTPKGKTRTTLTHEVGHWLNLHHTWGPKGNDPGDSKNCGVDDFVDDTPLCRGARNCKLGLNTCDGDNDYWGFDQVDNIENFMSYSTCRKMFTEGQKDRMRAALNSSVGGRNNIWREENLAEVGATESYQLCGVKFKSDRTNICPGEEVAYLDQSFSGQIVAWQWKFEGGTPSNSTDRNPKIRYNNPGSYSVFLEVTDENGNKRDTTYSEFITVLSNPQFKAPYYEGFEYSNGLYNTGWDTESGNILKWSVDNQVSSSGNRSIKLTAQIRKENKYIFNAMDTDYLTSPRIDMSKFETALLSFKYAHSRYVDTLSDKLRVQFSTNCGKMWSTIKVLSKQLTTAPPHTIEFHPDQSEWKTANIKIESIYMNQDFQFRFKYDAGGGNNVYIDDINIRVKNDVGISETMDHAKLTVYPNPIVDYFTVICNSGIGKNLSIKLYDLQGKELVELWNGVKSGSEFNLRIGSIQSGIYLLQVTAGNETIRKPIVIQR